MNIAVVGLSHRTAPVEVREKLSISDDHIEESFNSLKSNEQIIEVSILSTCNRLEIYALVKNPDKEIKSLIEWLGFNWMDEYLTPHLNYRTVSTASNVQVRAPINKKSLDGWKNYKIMLEPAMKIINKDNLHYL